MIEHITNDFLKHVYVVNPSSGGGGSSDPFFNLTTFTDPNLQTWSNGNFGGVVTRINGTNYITLKASSAVAGQRYIYMPQPTIPYVITAFILPTYGANGGQSGPIFRESSSGKKVGFCYYSNAGAGFLFVGKADTDASWTFQITNTAFLVNAYWARISDDGVNRKGFISGDGVVFTEIYSESDVSYITADQVGFYFDTSSGTFGGSSTLVSWDIT